MGLFGSTKITVSSVVYNLAGDVENRPNFLKTAMVGAVLTNSKQTKGEMLRKSYLGGMGIKSRSFYRWADDNYSLIGIPRSTMVESQMIAPEALAPNIPHLEGTVVVVQDVQVSPADFAFWAEQWMFENEPALIDTDWVADFDDATNQIVITFADDTTERFTPANFNKTARYIVATYSVATPKSQDALVPGSRINLADGEAYPSVSGWETVQDLSLPQNTDVKVTTVRTSTYSDSRPAEVQTTLTNQLVEFEQLRSIYSITEYQGADPGLGVDRMKSIKKTMSFFRDRRVVSSVQTTTTTETLSGGVVKTVVVETTTETLVIDRAYQLDTQAIYSEAWSPVKMFIYRIGSGNAVLDALVTTKAPTVLTATQDGYLPFIPIRLNNNMVSETYLPDVYALAKKAYKKATGRKFDDIAKTIADHEKVGDIDYAYMMFGASLNTGSQASRKYIYQFFNMMRKSQANTAAGYTNYDTTQSATDTQAQTYFNWRAAQDNPASPAYNTPSPGYLGSMGAPITEVNIKSTGSVNTNVDIRLTWNSITETRGTGKLKPDAKVGEIWFDQGGSTIGQKDIMTAGERFGINTGPSGGLDLCWQVSANSWRKLTVVGLLHRNYIYDGHFVETTVSAALESADESGFLIPIHYKTLNTMSLVDATQLATESGYMVLNMYTVKKTGFFGSTFFKILLFVAVIAITVATAGTAAPLVGILGSAASVGAAVGLTGLAALIVGATLNAIAAMILMQLIQLGATAIFGEKFGAIIGAIIAIVALSVGTAMVNGQSLQTALQALTKVDNIIKMTSAVGDGVAGVIAADARETAISTQKILTDYNAQSKKLSELYAQNVGYDRGSINPLILTDAPGSLGEFRDSFLERTLMTGSDIAELSMTLVSDFADITLSTNLQR